MAGALRCLGLRLREGSPFVTYIALKAHRARSEDAQQGPAVFVAGLAHGFDEKTTTAVFSCFGNVTKVALHPNKLSGIVVFEEERSRDAALAYAGEGQIVEYYAPEIEEATGLKSRLGRLKRHKQPVKKGNSNSLDGSSWVQRYKAQRPGTEALRSQLDDWIASHEDGLERQRKERQAAMSEDGWTVVVRSKGRKRGKNDGGVATVSGGIAPAAAAAMAAQKTSKAKPAEDFYRFQTREKRRDELLELRRKFDEDKRRISQLRASRNFKPY